MTGTASNNLNINLPDNNAVLRLEVELRDKNTRRRQLKNKTFTTMDRGGMGNIDQTRNLNNYFVPMVKVSKNVSIFGRDRGICIYIYMCVQPR